MAFTDPLTSTLGTLDLIAAKQKALVTNLANMDTPNYKRKDISFAQYMGVTANPLETKMSAKMGPSPVTVQSGSGPIDPATELSEMQKNAILYTMAIRRMSSAITQMKSVINLGNG